MRSLQAQHIVLLRVLNDHCLFLTRHQIERILTRAKRGSNKELAWLVSEGYLERRYRLDSFRHFQFPLYHLGPVGWRMARTTQDGYKQYQREIAERSRGPLEHLLSVSDVLIKFILEAKVTRIIGGEDKFWQETVGLGNIPDAWIQFNGSAAFIEVDRGTESPEVVMKKIANYIRCQRSGSYQMMFPYTAFKVLFITTTEERIEAFERQTTSDDIWYATMDEFLREKLNHRHWFARLGFYALPVAPKEAV